MAASPTEPLADRRGIGQASWYDIQPFVRFMRAFVGAGRARAAGGVQDDLVDWARAAHAVLEWHELDGMGQIPAAGKALEKLNAKIDALTRERPPTDGGRNSQQDRPGGAEETIAARTA